MLHERCFAEDAPSTTSRIGTHVQRNAPLLRALVCCIDFDGPMSRKFNLNFLIESNMITSWLPTAEEEGSIRWLGALCLVVATAPHTALLLHHSGWPGSAGLCRQCSLGSGLLADSNGSSQPHGACLTCYSFLHSPTPLLRQWSLDCAGSLRTATSDSHQFQE